MVDLADRVRDVPDFPEPGVAFKDLTPLLAEGDALADAVARLASWARGRRPEVVVAPEAWGFPTGAALAVELGCAFVPARKPGKLPSATLRASYVKEYGPDALELSCDAALRGRRVLVHDNVLALGATTEATCRLVEELGGVVVGVCFLAELAALRGRVRLRERDVHALLVYEERDIVRTGD
jgi:adenine phosphoribosyltransferase